MLSRRIRALVLAIAALGLLAVPVERGAARSGVYASMQCYSAGHQRVECYGYASGGSGSYYNDWTPNPQPPRLHRCGIGRHFKRCRPTPFTSVLRRPRHVLPRSPRPASEVLKNPTLLRQSLSTPLLIRPPSESSALREPCGGSG